MFGQNCVLWPSGRSLKLFLEELCGSVLLAIILKKFNYLICFCKLGKCNNLSDFNIINGYFDFFPR